MEAYTPDLYNLATHHIGRSPESLVRTPQTLRTPQTISITGRSTVPVDDDYDRMAAAIQRGAHRDNRRVVVANHNAVEIQRIMAGIDVRTTVRLSQPVRSQHSPHSDHAS